MEDINSRKNAHPVLQLVPSEFSGSYEELSHLLTCEPDPNKVYEARGDTLLNVLRMHSLNSLLKLAKVQDELDNGPGYVVVRGTGIEAASSELAQLAAITLSSVYGHPTRTDRRKSQIAWPIRYDPEATGQKTFSQTMEEAAYHTDTQYFQYPEKYFGLFCIVADKPGKGTNLLVNGLEVVQQIDQEVPEVGATLRTEYPFRVPTVFTRSGKAGDVEVVKAPIVSPEGSIRYRKDTLIEAAALLGTELSRAQIEAVEVFETYLLRARTHKYHLQPGEVLFVNNHRLLHARTPYDNRARLLYRVRMEAVR